MFFAGWNAILTDSPSAPLYLQGSCLTVDGKRGGVYLTVPNGAKILNLRVSYVDLDGTAGNDTTYVLKSSNEGTSILPERSSKFTTRASSGATALITFLATNPPQYSQTARYFLSFESVGSRSLQGFCGVEVLYNF